MLAAQFPYALRDVDGRPITEAEGRAIVAERYKVSDEVRQARRRANRAKQLKGRTSRRNQKSAGVAPASGSSTSRKSTGQKSGLKPLTRVRNSNRGASLWAGSP